MMIEKDQEIMIIKNKADQEEESKEIPLPTSGGDDP
jgi:hypothetical protein